MIRAIRPITCSRRRVVLTLLCLQMLLLVLGGLIMTSQSRHAMLRHLRDDLPMVQDDVADLVLAAVKGDPRLRGGGLRDRAAVADALEHVEIPEGTNVALLDHDGRLLWISEPCTDGEECKFRDHNATDWSSFSFETESGSFPLIDAGDKVLIGTLVTPDGYRLKVATAPLGGFDGRVVVHQPVDELMVAASRHLRVVWLSGALVSLGIVALTFIGIGLLGRRYETAIEAQNRSLEREVARRVDEAVRLRDALIVGLATLADYRDNDTGRHLERIAEYTGLLAEALRGEHPEIDDDWIARAKLASSMHDIGKVGIGDAVLLKPGPLTGGERACMERHPSIGADTLIAIRGRLGSDPLIDMAIQITLGHHERWDGSGYPLGLAGEEIALPARIVAVADVYDAITSTRVYKGAVAHGEAVEQIVRGAGTQFDPGVVRAFEQVAGEFDAVRASHLPPGSGAEPLAA